MEDFLSFICFYITSVLLLCLVLLDGGVPCDVLCLCVPVVPCKSGLGSGTGHAICKYRNT